MTLTRRICLLRRSGLSRLQTTFAICACRPDLNRVYVRNFVGKVELWVRLGRVKP